MTKKWFYKGYILEIFLSAMSSTPYWAHVIEFPKGCSDDIINALYDYSFDDISEDLAITGLKLRIDRLIEYHNAKTENGKYKYICE